MFGPISQAEFLLIIMFLLAFIVFPFWRIFGKAGFPGWYSIFVIIHGFILIALIFLAFSKWPIHKAIEESGIALPIKGK